MKYAVVLCGGIGERLWPVSSKTNPKQFCSFTDQHTLLDQTLQRIPSNFYIILVTNILYRGYISKKYPTVHTVYESVSKNTGLSVYLGLEAVNKLTQDNDPVVVLPSDHYFDPMQFTHTIANAVENLDRNAVTLFGIMPTYPETGYGYIRHSLEEITGFVEKPQRSVAETMVLSGEYLWNSGIYMFGAKFMLKQFRKYAPQVEQYCELGMIEDLQDESIDKMIMEKLGTGNVVRYEGVWNDVGDWNRVPDVKSAGVVVEEGCNGSRFFNDNGTMLGLGLQDIVVVKQGPDVLVASRHKLEELKVALKSLSKEHIRPWGWYETVHRSAGMVIKRLVVYPGKRLSLQYHNHRTEHWTIVAGSGIVTVGEEKTFRKKDDCIFIGIGVLHRAENTGEENLVMVEVQQGNYLAEDDIVRVEDDYNRA